LRSYGHRPGECREVDVELRSALLRHHEGEVGDLLVVDEHHAAVLAGLGDLVHHRPELGQGVAEP
jgi:hypothetical protein